MGQNFQNLGLGGMAGGDSDDDGRAESRRGCMSGMLIVGPDSSIRILEALFCGPSSKVIVTPVAICLLF